MKILIIPDVHLKLFMFITATKIMKEKQADMAIFLGDLPDDWFCVGNLPLYQEVFDRCIKFKEEFPNTKYCYGNHELAYYLGKPCSGTDTYNIGVIAHMVIKLQQAYDDDAKIVHKIDNTLFSHAGLTTNYIRKFLSRETELGISDEELLNRINYLDDKDNRLWDDTSPVWARPQEQEKKSKLDRLHLYGDYKQVVGHTPVRKPTEEGKLLTLDNFSEYSDGTDYGNKRFVIYDTEKETWEYANEF